MRLILTCAAVLALAAAAAAPAAEPPKETVVLDLERGSFRAFEGWRTPTLISPDGKLKPLLEPRKKDQKAEDRKPVPVQTSDRPPADWTSPDFDDSGWPRVADQVALNKWPVAIFNRTDYAPNNPLEGDLVCLRGKFRVADSGQVRDLKLALRYYGGAVVYVNGVELQRGHLPAGKLEPGTLAERYPDEAYVQPGGKILPGYENPPPEVQKTRWRTLPAKGAADGVSIPGAMLRKGVNVVAVEVRAAPVNELLVEGSVGSVFWQGERKGWPHAGAVEARVTAAAAAGLTGNAGPTQEIALSNSGAFETVYASEFAHPGAQVFPIRMVGARNGTFSGKVVLSSAGAIRKLKAAASELAQAGGQGRIPSTAVQVRLAERAADPAVTLLTHWDPLGCVQFDRLLTEFPAEVPPATLTGARLKLAVAPVWVTVHVPADAPAGEYRGTLTVETEGSTPFKQVVPVHLKVNGWRIPDPRDFVTHNNIYPSVDSVAQYYKVPLWSERHFELMGRSLAAFQQVGNKVCVLHLTARTPGLNNTESMVRWIRKGEKEFEHDFTIAEKYLDLYEQTCGKPGILCIDIWHCPSNTKEPKTVPTLPVTVLDPATGKVEPMPQPPYGTPENEAFWKPVLTELRKRLEKRGWWDVTAVCHVNYAAGPIPQIVDALKHIWPDGRWMNSSHPFLRAYGGTAKDVSMPIPYNEYVWGAGIPYNPDAAGTAPGARYPRAWTGGAREITVGNPRYGVGFLLECLRPYSPLAAHRFAVEGAVQGNLRGIGRPGGDSWPLPIGKGGRMATLFDDFKGVGPGESTVALFSPGPDGAVFNARMEVFREGVQVVEAIVFLQRAQEEKRVSAEVGRRIDELLDERARYYLRAQENCRAGTRWRALECSDWQGRDDRLFALCAEVAARK